MSSIPAYFLVISSVVCICLFWIRYRAQKFGFDIRRVMDLSLISMIAGFIGARLLHVFYEYPEIYIESPWRVFDFGRGGYVYYGGLLTGLGAGLIVLSRMKNSDPYSYLDLFAPVLSFGYATGRVACFVSGCCYGPITDLPWAYLVSDPEGQLLYRHPTPIYASLLEALILCLLFYVEKNRQKIRFFNFKNKGSLFFLWLFLHSLSRFILEFWRDDFRGPAFLFSLSGWISLILAAGALHFLRQNLAPSEAK